MYGISVVSACKRIFCDKTYSRRRNCFSFMSEMLKLGRGLEKPYVFAVVFHVGGDLLVGIGIVVELFGHRCLTLILLFRLDRLLGVRLLQNDRFVRLLSICSVLA